MFSNPPYTGSFFAKDREVASANLTEARMRIDAQARTANFFCVSLYLFSFVSLLGTPASYLLTENAFLALACATVGTLCGIGAVFFTYAKSLLWANVASIKLQLEDFHRKETALLNILEHLDDVIRSEFHRLGYPKRSLAEGYLEISKALERDLGKLTIELHESSGEVHGYMRKLRESEGVARLTGLSGYLTTTGFQQEAVDELFGLLSERLHVVREIVRNKPVRTEHAVELIMAAIRFDEAMQVVRDYHDERSAVSLDDVRAERERRSVAAE